MFGKKKKEKKGKWWKSNDQLEFETAAGTSYRILTGMMVLFIIGILMMGISIVIKSVLRTNPSNQKAASGLL